MAEVRLHQVGKVFPGDVRAVRDVTLTVEDGEFIVLVGPSGCGKSTTLRMIAGLEEVSSGTISIGSRDVTHLAPKDRDIAMVFQNYALYPHMSVFDNMAFGLKLRKVPRAEIRKRVLETARLLGIEALLERKPKALSGGQRQRVAVGRAIVREPAAFLFDEPLSNLDAKLRVETRAELKRLHQRLKTTSVYVTHDQEEAMTLGDRLVVMSDGMVQQVDTPLTIYERPCNRFVAGFLGTPPMNFLRGSLAGDGDRLAFRTAGFHAPLTADMSARLLSHRDETVVLGLRPELFRHPLGEAPEPGWLRLGFQVDVVEPLGHLMDVRLVSGEARLTARVEARPFQPGSSVELDLDARKLHCFAEGTYGPRLS